MLVVLDLEASVVGCSFPTFKNQMAGPNLHVHVSPHEAHFFAARELRTSLGNRPYTQL